MLSQPLPPPIHPPMSHLEQLEQRIDQRFLREHQPPNEAWFTTVLAVHEILSTHSYKPDFHSVDDYLQRRWNNCCTRQTLYNLSTAGKVIFILQPHFQPYELPSNTNMCRRVDDVHRKKGIPHRNIWTRVLEHFRDRDNVIAKEIAPLFEERIPSRVPTPESTPPPPRTIAPSAEPSAEPTRRSARLQQLQQSTSATRSTEDPEPEIDMEIDVTDREPSPPLSEASEDSHWWAYDTEWNTPPMYIGVINEFAALFGGIDLDPCWNPESKIVAHHMFGRLQNRFIDALTMENWLLPANITELQAGVESHTKKVKLAYLNPPYCMGSIWDVGEEQSDARKTSLSQFHVKLWEQMEKGNVETALIFAPFFPAKKSCAQFLTNSIMCHLKSHPRYDLTLEARRRTKTTRKSSQPMLPVVFYLVSKIRPLPFRDDFIRIFKDVGYIMELVPGVYE